MSTSPKVAVPAAADSPGESDYAHLRERDSVLADLVIAEEERQRGSLLMMAGENYAFPAVRDVMGSLLINKYAEGYPERRHHSGCEIVDKIEELAIQRATALFGAEYANVQPYSGTSAVLAAYAAILHPGDSVLAMALEHGGHFTQGLPDNLSGHLFDFHWYQVRRDTHLIDYDQVRDMARKTRPKAIVCGGNYYPRHIDYQAFRQIADEVGAYLLVDAAPVTGLVAGGAAPNPVPYADIVCAVTYKTLRGPRGGLILSHSHLSHRLDAAVYPFAQGGPHMHSIAAKAAALGEAATPQFATYAHQTVANARTLAHALTEHGLLLSTGGTDTHQVITDVTPLGLTGPQARTRCTRAGIIIDSCPLPYDAQPADKPSGIRMGTAALTAQGMTEKDILHIAQLMTRTLHDTNDVHTTETATAVSTLITQHPPR
ncbi:serine hydroxymethyltransferase [Streptomyces sp. NPDC051776]|uniref:serine hydroxymethyltransferase n=1 Tax=Streptomyces sp. NPDC051776 TaxID=3155414 RepID=UPI00342183CF